MPAPPEVALLVVGGLVAGFINTLAGGGSFLTVPLLIFMGLPPTAANATNRVGVLIQSLAATGGFRQEGIPGVDFALRLLPPMLLGSWLGAFAASNVPEDLFRRGFGMIMILALPLILRNPRPREARGRALSDPLQLGIYFAIGLYGGAIQAGIGIPLLLALVGAGGLGLVTANSVKVVMVAALTAVALAQFAWAGKVFWIHGLILALGSGIGGYAASRMGVRLGARLIQPVLIVMVLALAIRLLLPA